MLSAPLRAAIGETLAAGDQAILFLNRRGFATFVLCRACGHSFRCPHCSVSLTYHRYSDRLSCHYCGYRARVPERCPECKATGTIVRKGLGTEKVAEAVAAEFPARARRAARSRRRERREDRGRARARRAPRGRRPRRHADGDQGPRLPGRHARRRAVRRHRARRSRTSAPPSARSSCSRRSRAAPAAASAPAA